MTTDSLSIISFKHRGFQLRSVLDEATARELFDDLLDKSYEIEKVFKDSRATYAAQLKIKKESVVYKIPRARLRRQWERIVTLFRDSESIRSLKNLQLMQELGFRAPLPLLAGEKRRKGFVVDSFCCYRFINAKVVEPDDARLVIEELLALHRKGYLRTDAKPANFLMNEKGVVFIDFRLKKPVLFPTFKKKIELARLVRGYPASLKFIPESIRTSPSFTLAAWLERKNREFKGTRRRMKRIFKSD
ncbi:MAG: hypothetical protein ABF379_06520 [Akkermansiaceae bacterium]